MRALLIGGLLMLWVYCLVGAVLLTTYLVALGIANLRALVRGVKRTSPKPPRGAVAGLVVFACVMAAFAVGLAAVVPAGEVGSVLAWSAFPSWSAVAGGTTAALLSRRAARQSDVPGVVQTPADAPDTPGPRWTTTPRNERI